MAVSLFAVFAVIAGAQMQQDLVTTPPMPPLERHREAQHRGSTYPDVSLIFPEAGAVKAAWPARALDDEVQGAADVDCGIKADGTLTQCELVAESPMGYGFGKATVVLFTTQVRADLSSVPGGWTPKMRVACRWHWEF